MSDKLCPLAIWGCIGLVAVALWGLSACFPLPVAAPPPVTLTQSPTATPTSTATPTPLPSPPVPFSLFPEMVKIDGGIFRLGSAAQEIHLARRIMDEFGLAESSNWEANETPTQTLRIQPFYISKYEVTNAQYAAFVFLTSHPAPEQWEGGIYPAGRDQHPVTGVSWYDALAYCKWLSEVTGVPYRLPTEAEWEYAARGPQGRPYSWGGEWQAQRCNCDNRNKGTTYIGSHPRDVSPHGVMDTIGNVAEWTNTLFMPYPYDPADGREDLAGRGPRVVRGGWWGANRHNARAAFRRSFPAAQASEWIGFRVARDANLPSP